MHVNVPPALAAIASGRDCIKTAEAATALNRASQTLKKLHCLQGHAFGIKPIKFGNRLLWPVASIANVLNGGVE